MLYRDKKGRLRNDSRPRWDAAITYDGLVTKWLCEVSMQTWQPGQHWSEDETYHKIRRPNHD